MSAPADQPSRPPFASTALVVGALYAALGLAPVAAAPPGTSTSSTLYCCLDANGKQVCGDILPQACYGRGYREIGDGARTVRQVEAPLTAEQRAQRAIEDEKRRIEELARREQQRKDQALLNTYGSERDIDTMRARSEEDVHKSIKSAEAKIAEMRIQRKRFEDEAEFYKKKTMPSELAKELRTVEHEIRLQQEIIDSKKRDFETIKAKYGADRQRYTELTGRTSPASRTKPPTR